MKIAKCDIVPYTRAFKKPLKFAYGTLDKRSGFYIDITTSDGIVGSGEIAPLPLYRPVSLNGIAESLEIIRRKITGQIISRDAETIEKFVREIAPPDFTDTFGVTCAILDAATRSAQKPMAKILNKNVRSAVPVNCLISSPVDDWEALTEYIHSRGYRAAKIKVGANSVQEDAALVKTASSHVGPDISIRLDANGAWSLQEATEFFRLIEGTPIDYIEEPICGTLAELREFKKSVGVAVALDESLNTYVEITTGARSDYCDVIIIKPSLLYGPVHTILACETVVSCEKRVVLTSMLETETGLASLINIAAALPGVLEPAGFDTLSVFAEYCSDFSLVTDGAINVPEGIGIGYERSNRRPY